MRKFFIIGCPRSGTTMLQQALNRHSRIAIPAETKFFFSFLDHPLRHQRRHLQRLNSDLQIDLPPLDDRIHTQEQARGFFEEIARRYVRRLKRPEITHFGEKTPEHTSRLHRILEVFPESRIIFIYRDGRDVALSLSKVPWMHAGLYANFAVWLYFYRVLVRAREARLPNVLLVRYEDLAARPECRLREILQFLDLEYEPAVAHGHGNSEGIPDREFAWKGRALERISTERSGAWRQQLSSEQIEGLEWMGAGALRELGYDLMTDGCKRMSLRHLMRLSWDLVSLVGKLPWLSLVNELLSPTSVACQRKVGTPPIEQHPRQLLLDLWQ